MSYPPISPDGAWIHVAIILGRMEQRQADQARSLDTLIRILQEQTLSPSQKPEAPQPSSRSMLGPIIEKVASKVSTDLLVKLLWMAVRYLLPAAVMASGLIKSLLRMLGLL
jgi:hypothetical protein